MSVNKLAYNGMHVAGFRPDYAPNPSCCSDPEVMCPACTGKALHESGFVTNARHGPDDLDDGDILPLPVLNFQKDDTDDEERRLHKENMRRLGWNVDDEDEEDDDLTDNRLYDDLDDGDVLPVPKFDWQELAYSKSSPPVRNKRCGCSSHGLTPDDDDILPPPPRMFG